MRTRREVYWLVVLIIAAVTSATNGHQSIAYPVPISTTKACRVSNGQNCPGPCPRKDLRSDQTPNSPSITVRRGQTIVVQTLKNNHIGGFARWTLVKVKHMYDKKKHSKNAFLYTCADQRVTKCVPENRFRNCRFDHKNEYYRHHVRIPTIYPDDVYVLGWVWYGGAVRHGKSGDFGDYYDCVYVRIRGGPVTHKHKPSFHAGPSLTGKGGLCLATVDRIGVCWREPCPGGNRRTEYLTPSEFNGRTPHPILRSTFRKERSRKPSVPKKKPKPRKKKPSKKKPRSEGRFPKVSETKKKKAKTGTSGIRVQSLKVRHADYPWIIYGDTKRGFYFYLRDMRNVLRFTLTADVGGDVRYVAFYINGKRVRNDFSRPYSASAEYTAYVNGRKILRYSPYLLGIGRWSLKLECQVVGTSGVSSWSKLMLYTYP